MKTSQKGIDLIKQFEGFCSKAIRLSGEQYFTIGYGHYGQDVKPGQTITREEAEQLLRQDLAKMEVQVDVYLAKALFTPNQNQYDALLSFCYNCGPGSVKTLVTGRTAAQVAEHITAYTKSASPAYTQGLLNRRLKERALFLEGWEDEEASMEAKDLWKKIEDYLAGQSAPAWAAKEMTDAKAAGIWDGSTPMMLIPRYQAALMAYRARNRALQEYDAAMDQMRNEIDDLQNELKWLREELNRKGGA